MKREKILLVSGLGANNGYAGGTERRPHFQTAAVRRATTPTVNGIRAVMRSLGKPRASRRAVPGMRE